MPIAQPYGFGANAINYCCPTEKLVRPVAGETVDNQCSPCYPTTLSNCANYGENYLTIIWVALSDDINRVQLQT